MRPGGASADDPLNKAAVLPGPDDILPALRGKLSRADAGIGQNCRRVLPDGRLPGRAQYLRTEAWQESNHTGRETPDAPHEHA